MSYKLDDKSLDKIIRSNKTEFLKNIKKKIKKNSDTNKKSVRKCLSSIKKDLKKLKHTKKTKNTTDQDKLDLFLNEDLERAYNKPWDKLKEIHKIKKMEECIRDFDISSEKKEKLIKKAKKLIQKKELKSKDIKYDKGTIKNI